jgi:ribosomal protein S18 acetylase RimI-like enzyme
MGIQRITIREAVPADATEIARVHDDAWRSTYQGIIPHLHLEKMITRRSPVWWHKSLRKSKAGISVLTFDDIVQGYVSFGPARIPHRSKTGEIFELYLAPTFQGLGLGKKLFVAARQTLNRQGWRSLLVWALAENEGACSFYSRLGGRRCASSPERYGDITLNRIAFFWEPVGRATR